MKNEKFLKVAQERHFFDKHKHVLVAVSGGKDSMCLLQTLYDSRETLEINLGIVHINHGQRKASEKEEDYLKDWAHEHGIPIFIDYFQGKFSEMAARDFRYGFFKKVMKDKGYTALVTAHHADDQAETIFMRFLRGSRLRHLSGIAPVQSFGPGQLIRPFLDFRKDELEVLFYFEDESNNGTDFLRNRVRNLYLSDLTKENPKFEQALVDFGQETELLLTALKFLTKNIIVTDMQQFLVQEEAIQYFLLQDYIEKIPDLELTKAQFQAVLHILRTKANYCQHLKKNYYLIKDYRNFTIEKIVPKTDEFLENLTIKSQGLYSFGKFIFSLDQVLENADQVLFLEKNQPLAIRKRQNGDVLLLNGYHKKVNRYFIDQKIPQKERDETYIIEQNKKVYGIANIVASDLSKLLKNDTMKSTLYIKMKE
ncbi:tRNA lysidine(34) synthetase TilS [Streptococcus sp. X16XC17]|uniref:tRNA lysidine(34) synthetase TilS n=1 Tax=unclassified Streptococcus TaxID=2608887 RepID=UPI00066FF4A9|nr:MULTISPECIES: tRNA lysidine(34) synthetase TilS [unclassified Streptococcus]TCD45492.1 tRNA lysidine(34) synthetase TilS [Streptococcus sp. X16XC17]